ncbi:MAG: hypothetical protein RJA70_3147 [Pseudomonadota bacterium]|jgi:hypothetical protein
MPSGTESAYWNNMPLLTVVGVIVVVGVLLWVINSFIPMDGKVRNILNAVVVFALVLWLLDVFGVLGSLRGVKVGKLSDDNAAELQGQTFQTSQGTISVSV